MIDIQDEEFWFETIKDVKKIPQKKVEEKHLNKKIKTKVAEKTIRLTVYKHNLKLGTTSDIDRNTLKKFKKEEFGVDAVLDLHGFTEEKAYPAVCNFITNSYLGKKRCILIITGKGSNHKDEDIFAPKGVLKDIVPKWFQTDELKQLILTYIHPSEKLGGCGALYILLRRNRA